MILIFDADRSFGVNRLKYMSRLSQYYMVEEMSRALDKQLQYQAGNQNRYGVQNDDDNPENRTFLSDSLFKVIIIILCKTVTYIVLVCLISKQYTILYIIIFRFAKTSKEECVESLDIGGEEGSAVAFFASPEQVDSGHVIFSNVVYSELFA